MSSRRIHFVKLVAVIAIIGVAVAWFMSGRRLPTVVQLPEIPRHDMGQADGRWHQSGATNPFTGWMVDHYPDGAPLSRSLISNGLPNGVSETWYTNGQMQVREHFKDGLSDGLREKWYENGAKLSQAMIAGGKVTGIFQSWHDNGQLSEQIPMNLGRADGTGQAYYPSGFLKAETTVQDGTVLDRKSWKDGERKAASY